MNLRDGVLIHPNAIGPTELAFFSSRIRRARMTDSPVSNFEDEARLDAVEWVINTDVRNTQAVHLPKTTAQKLDGIHAGAVAAIVNPYYQVEVRDSEPLQVLHYGVGGHYIPHVDAETLYKDDDGLELWEKTLDRDLSVVYFLNDDFSGGELFFPSLDLSIRPEAGTLVCFPSDHNYIHGVRPVTKGHRYTLVTWMRVQGMPSLDEINQATMDEYNRRWPKQISQPPRLAKGGRAGVAGRGRKSLS